MRRACRCASSNYRYWPAWDGAFRSREGPILKRATDSGYYDTVQALEAIKELDRFCEYQRGNRHLAPRCLSLKRGSGTKRAPNGCPFCCPGVVPAWSRRSQTAANPHHDTKLGLARVVVHAGRSVYPGRIDPPSISILETMAVLNESGANEAAVDETTGPVPPCVTTSTRSSGSPCSTPTAPGVERVTSFRRVPDCPCGFGEALLISARVRPLPRADVDLAQIGVGGHLEPFRLRDDLGPSRMRAEVAGVERVDLDSARRSASRVACGGQSRSEAGRRAPARCRRGSSPSLHDGRGRLSPRAIR